MSKKTKEFLLSLSKKIVVKISVSVILYILSVSASLFTSITKKITNMGTEFWIDFTTRSLIGIFLIVIYLISSKLIEKYYAIKTLQEEIKASQEEMLNDQIWINSISAIIEYFRFSNIHPQENRTNEFNRMVVFIYNKLRHDLPDAPNSKIYAYITKAFSLSEPNSVKDIIEQIQK